MNVKYTGTFYEKSDRHSNIMELIRMNNHHRLEDCVLLLLTFVYKTSHKKNTPALQMVAGKGCFKSKSSPANDSGERVCLRLLYDVFIIIYLLYIVKKFKGEWKECV